MYIRTGKLNFEKGDYDGLRKSLDIQWVDMFTDYDKDVDKMWQCLTKIVRLNEIEAVE